MSDLVAGILIGASFGSSIAFGVIALVEQRKRDKAWFAKLEAEAEERNRAFLEAVRE